MARYSKVDRRTWGDEKFNKLTRPQPNGQSLWIYLLTNPHRTSIPNIFVAGEAMMAEELHWSLEGFRKAFLELSREGMAKADWEARIVYLPNATKYNAPENPKVVLGWKESWDLIPESKLKVEAWEALKAFMEGFSGGFAESFRIACPKPLVKSMAYPEPEPEPESPPTPQSVNGVEKPTMMEPTKPARRREKQTPTITRDQVELIYQAYPRKVGKAKALPAIERAISRIKAEGNVDPVAFLLKAVETFASSDAGNRGRFTPHPATWFNAGRWDDDPGEWGAEEDPDEEEKVETMEDVARGYTKFNELEAAASAPYLERYRKELEEQRKRAAEQAQPA